jgi:hypothetical protein
VNAIEESSRKCHPYVTPNIIPSSQRAPDPSKSKDTTKNKIQIPNRRRTASHCDGSNGHYKKALCSNQSYPSITATRKQPNNNTITMILSCTARTLLRSAAVNAGRRTAFQAVAARSAMAPFAAATTAVTPMVRRGRRRCRRVCTGDCVDLTLFFFFTPTLSIPF